jgi:hypothetical protein
MSCVLQFRFLLGATGGHRLGPVGGTIVTEVLVGLIDADATSFRRNQRDWRPLKTFSELLAS